jgi:hypothetical protein
MWDKLFQCFKIVLKVLYPYRFLLYSFMLHLLVLVLLLFDALYRPQHAPQPQNVTISLIERSKGIPKPQRAHESLNRGPKKAQHGTEPKRPALNSKDFAPGKVPLDVLLTGNEYVARVKALVEPRLIRILRARTKGLRAARVKPPRCETEVLIVLNAAGNYVSITQTQFCPADKVYDEALTQAFKELVGLPPPPKNLLEDGKLEMMWRLMIQ